MHRHAGQVVESFSIGLGLESSTFTADYEFEIGIQSDGKVAILDERISCDNKLLKRKMFNFSLKEFANQSSEYPSDTLMLSVMGDSPIVANHFADSIVGNTSRPEEKSLVGSTIVKMTNFIGDMHFYHMFPNVMREPRRLKVGDKLEEDGANLASVLLPIVQQKDDAYKQLLDALRQVVPDVENLRVLETGVITTFN